MSSSNNLPAARYLGEAGEISSDMPLISLSASPGRDKSPEVAMVPSISKPLLAEGSSSPPPQSPVMSTNKHNHFGGQLLPPKINVLFENINGKPVHVRCRRKIESYIAIIVAEIGIEGLARVVADHRVNFRKLVNVSLETSNAWRKIPKRVEIEKYTVTAVILEEMNLRFVVTDVEPRERSERNEALSSTNIIQRPTSQRTEIPVSLTSIHNGAYQEHQAGPVMGLIGGTPKPTPASSGVAIPTGLQKFNVVMLPLDLPTRRLKMLGLPVPIVPAPAGSTPPLVLEISGPYGQLGRLYVTRVAELGATCPHEMVHNAVIRGELGWRKAGLEPLRIAARSPAEYKTSKPMLRTLLKENTRKKHHVRKGLPSSPRNSFIKKGGTTEETLTGTPGHQHEETPPDIDVEFTSGGAVNQTKYLKDARLDLRSMLCQSTDIKHKWMGLHIRVPKAGGHPAPFSAILPSSDRNQSQQNSLMMTPQRATGLSLGQGPRRGPFIASIVGKRSTPEYCTIMDADVPTTMIETALTPHILSPALSCNAVCSAPHAHRAVTGMATGRIELAAAVDRSAHLASAPSSSILDTEPKPTVMKLANRIQESDAQTSPVFSALDTEYPVLAFTSTKNVPGTPAIGFAINTSSTSDSTREEQHAPAADHENMTGNGIDGPTLAGRKGSTLYITESPTSPTFAKRQI